MRINDPKVPVTMASRLVSLDDDAPEPARPPPERRAEDVLWQTLRDATQGQHRLLDQTMSTLNLADSADYVRFLTIHRDALHGLRTQWRADDDADFSALQQSLDRDLQALGCRSKDSEAPPAPAGAPTPSQWGVSYVIRGSRLGGALLRRRVPDDYASAYLDYSMSLSWPAFLKQLGADSRLGADPHALVAGALRAYAAFANAASAICQKKAD